MQQEHRTGGDVLLTGATGFLGKVVLYELLRRRETLSLERVHVLVRPRKGRAAELRLRDEILASPCFSSLPEGWSQRVLAVEGDCEREHCGLDLATRGALGASVDRVIHCAASVEFDLPIGQAATANTASALRVLELARTIGGLEALVDVSTAYVTPHPGDGVPVEERLAPLPQDAGRLYDAIRAGRYDDADAEAALLTESGHPNTYTLTKSLAEHLLTERRDGLPLVLVRPSIISASHRRPFPGWIDSAAAFALFAVGIGTGRMRAVMARPKARLDLVPVDVVAERVVDAAFDGSARRGAGASEPPIRHAVAGYARSPSLRLAARRVGPFFERHPLAAGPAPRLRYLGPDGLRWRLWHRFQHERRPESASVANRIAETNRRFAYFTHNTFHFRASTPFEDPDFDPAVYLDAVCRGVWRHLLGGDEREVTIAGRSHRRDGGRLAWVLRQPRGNAFVRVAGYAVDAALARSHERVTVDAESFRAALAAVPPDVLLVLAPSHRSYLDFVLVSYLCFARPDLGIAIPHVAAASEFARIPLLGWLFRHLHAFYLERGRGREDKRVTEAVHRLVRQGRVLEFFVEGQRSRSRRILPPRRGLLRSLQATGQPCAVLPLAIAYDHVPEERGFLEELGGAPKAPMRLRDLLAWTSRLFRGEVELGGAHLACGSPVRLDLTTDVHAASLELVAQIQTRMVATTHHLRAFLEAQPLLDVDVAWLAGALARRGGRVLAVPPRGQPVHPAIERCLRAHFIHHFYPEAVLAFAGNPAVEHHVRRNAWAPSAGLRDPHGELADPRVRAVLRALFDPIRADYAAASRALGGGAVGEAVPPPAELVRRLEGAHLPDIEGLYEDLAERGVLVRSDEERRWAWGPRADEIAGYAEACACVGAEDT